MNLLPAAFRFNSVRNMNRWSAVRNPSFRNWRGPRSLFVLAGKCGGGGGSRSDSGTSIHVTY